MDKTGILTRILAVGGLVVMLVALLDPLEGFVLIAAGGGLVTWAAFRAESSYRKFLAWGVGLAAAGVVVSVGLAVLTGLAAGGPSAVPQWVFVMVLLAGAPYPIGAIMLLGAAPMLLRELFFADRPLVGNLAVAVAGIVEILLIARIVRAIIM